MNDDAGAELPTAGLTDRDGLLAGLAELVRRGQQPAVIAVRIRDLDGLVAADPDGAEAALQATMQRLAGLVRSADVLARIDAATFVLLGGGVPPEAAGGLAERLRGAVAFPVELADGPVSLTTDVRVAVPELAEVEPASAGTGRLGDPAAVAAAVVDRALGALGD